MKFLIIGLGSMGKRRIRNLRYLNVGEIMGYDIREDRRREVKDKYGIPVFETLEEALTKEPDVFIISTPPDQHYIYGLIALEHDKHFFMEANVLLEGMDTLISLCKSKNVVAAPSCTMRFHPAVKLMKTFLDNNLIGKCLAFTHHCGQYLPHWHPWEDYREFYAARRMTGACREMVAFELNWITYILGKVSKISCFKNKVSNLDIDIDDTYQILLEFENKSLGHMLIDVISRPAFRVCKIIGEEGTIVWDSAGKYVDVFTVDDNTWHRHRYDEGVPEKGYIYGEKMYIEEMAHFIRAINSKEKYIYSLEEDKEILSLLYFAEKSSDEGIHLRRE
jgi:predicted dehydrogenase